MHLENLGKKINAYACIEHRVVVVLTEIISENEKTCVKKEYKFCVNDLTRLLLP